MKPIKRYISLFPVLLITAIAPGLEAETGRLLGDNWPVLETFRELELRGEVPIQPNIWPDRSGRILRQLPKEPKSEAGRIWTEQLELWINRTASGKDTIRIIAEPGVFGILNNPRDPDDRFYPAFRLGGGMKRGVAECFVTYIVNLQWAKDPNYRGRQWEGFAGRPDQVYIRVAGEDWGIQFGKDYLAWAERLVIGKAHDPFERFDYEIEIGPFYFTGFAGFLNPILFYETSGDSTLERWAQRYISGHRLELLSPHFTLAIYETMVYGGVGRPPEIVYVVPFYWFHAEQLNRGQNDNTIVGGDMQLLFPPLRFSFEFLVDDIQVEKETQGDEEPDEIGLAAQLDFGTSTFGKWLTLSGRYEGVTNRTYNQRYPWNRYTFMGAPLGSELGNDADKTTFRTKLFACPEAILTAELFYLREGEGDIGDDWEEPWMEVEGPYSEPFPTGVVQKTAGFRLSWAGAFKRNGFWDIGFEYGSIENAGHEKNKKEDYWQIRMDVKCSVYPRISF